MPMAMAFSLLLATTLALLRLPAPVRGDALDDLWSQYVSQSQAEVQTPKYESTGPRRERNLDHWDVPTAAAYLGLHPATLAPLPRHVAELSGTEDASGTSADDASASLADEYVGHDAAVLFYAQWCQNCHAIAPSWDAIATLLDAGRRSANLVMALFDCEKSTEHIRLCQAAGVSVYPTFMYVGSGTYHDTDFVTRSVLGRDRSAGPFGATTLRRTVKFQGNWEYGDQLLDWVTIMRGLSRWHAVTESGPLRGLRNGLFGLLAGGKYRGGKAHGGKAGKEGSLPVGVPPNFQAELRGDGGSAGARSAETAALKRKLNTTEEERKLYERANTHSSHLIDGLLFPASGDAGANVTRRDPFALLTAAGGWHQNATTLPAGAPNDEHPQILRSCVLELCVDYCSRVTQRHTDAYLAELAGLSDTDPFPTLGEIEARLKDMLAAEEPYCALLEGCITGDYEGERCRPAEGCPFANQAACDYLGGCLDPRVQDTYGVALGLVAEGESVRGQDWGAANGATGGEASSATGMDGTEGGAARGAPESTGVGGWGIPLSA